MKILGQDGGESGASESLVKEGAVEEAGEKKTPFGGADWPR